MRKKKITLSEKLLPFNTSHQLLLLAIPFLLYVQTISFDFTYHDDDIIIVNNGATLEQFNLQKIFFTDAWLLNNKIELYRPWQTLTYAVDYFFSGSDASAYHLHNVLIFCLGIQLLYFLLLSFGMTAQTSFFLSMLYAVHFLFAHTVSWIPARGDLYLFAFSIAALLSFYFWLKKDKHIHLLLSMLFYFCALLSKETAIVMIPLIYITAFLMWSIELKKIKNYLLLLVGFMLTGIYIWMRAQSIHNTPNIFKWSGMIYNLPVIPEEVCKFFVPWFFSVMPAYSAIVTTTGIILISLIAILVYLFRHKINLKIILLGAVLFVLPVLPSIIYKPSFTGFAYDYLDHRMFFPGIGLLLIAYTLIIPVVQNKFSIKYVYGITALLFLITFINTKNYADYKSYYENATSTNPKSGLAWENYGSLLARNNNYPEAFKKFHRALEVVNNKKEIRTKLGDAYYTLKDFPKMFEQCRAMIKEDPTSAKGYYLIALFYSDNKKTDSALKYVNTAVMKNTKNAEAYFYRALIEQRMGKVDSAIKDFGKTILLNKEYGYAYFQRGVLLGNQNKFKEALTDFENYVKLNPNDPVGYFYRGQSYCVNGNTRQGCEDLHTAAQKGVKEAEQKIDYWCKNVLY